MWRRSSRPSSRASRSSRKDLDNLQAILTFLQELDTAEVGTHILEGVGEGMTAAGWDSDAETVAANLEAALNLALGIHSPSERVKPVGQNVSAGVGTGMTGYDFATDAAALAASLCGGRPGPARKRADGPCMARRR